MLTAIQTLSRSFLYVTYLNLHTEGDFYKLHVLRPLMLHIFAAKVE